MARWVTLLIRRLSAPTADIKGIYSLYIKFAEFCVVLVLKRITMAKHYLFLTGFLLSAMAASASKGADTNGSNISGTVVTNAAKPLRQVTIVVSSPCLLKPQEVETDENGNFNIGQLEPCTYKLTFETSGYKKVTTDKVVVVSDKKTQLKVQLQPDGLWQDTDRGTFSSQLQIYE